ncbi:O-antigen ligase family protein [Sphingomonas sp.]|uniref:O-antigen ligase family protein n=1 Tax=Sphingomonas sp. TaxID=28214 RepID=UPI0035BC873E
MSVLITIAVLFGGGSRADVASLPLVYAAAVIALAAAVAQVDRGALRSVRVPLALLAAFALVIAVQLIPLPPGVWRGLAGRASYARDLDLVGLGGTWRPLSLTPDLTLYALVALTPAFAVLMLAPLAGRLLGSLVPVLLILCALSATIAVLQVAGTTGSFYRITNQGAAVGLFANRNHQAALLVCALPLLAAWASAPDADPRHARVRLWLAGCAGATTLPLLLVTGSRGGLVFGVTAALASLAIVLRTQPRRRSNEGSSRRRLLLIGGAAALVVVLPIVAVLASSRGEALSRLVAGGDELRVANIGLYLRMTGDFFPWGSGFGAFDAVFRSYEPFAVLTQTYLNHAHDEPMELAIEAGLGGIVLTLAFAGWYVVRATAAWRSSRPAPTMLAGAVVLGVLLGWSVADYPLRTPSLLAVAAAACALLTERRRGRPATRLGNPAPIR